MKKLLAILLMTSPAAAGTLTVTVTGFPQFPSAVTHSFTTFSTADMTSTLAWGAVAFNTYLQATYNTQQNIGYVPTNTQIWDAIVHNWTQQGIIPAVAQFQTIPAQPATPITIGP
jgi:hypothetical protein